MGASIHSASADLGLARPSAPARSSAERALFPFLCWALLSTPSLAGAQVGNAEWLRAESEKGSVDAGVAAVESACGGDRKRPLEASRTSGSGDLGDLGELAENSNRDWMAEKAARTSIQRKISSRLLNAYRICRGEEVAPAGAGLRGSVAVDARGTTLVDITAQVTPDVLVGIRSAGGDIVNSFPRHNAIRARIPLEQLEAVASLPAVQFIRPADQAVTRPGGSRPPPRPSEATAP